jgi:retron-type reverse transcriptase
MRSVPAGSFQHLSSFPCLWVAWLDYRRGKRRRPAVADFALDADLALLHLHQALRAGHFRPSNYRVALVRDPKLRLVAAPNVGDRVLQRALLDAIGPTYERGFIHHNYAVGTGRGAHRAALAYLGWMRRLPWRMHLDISHYFASVEHERLMSLFARRLRDARTLDLLASLLAAGAEVYRHPLAEVALPELRVPPGRGLPLGGYLSHWAGGFYLDSLDHLVTRTLKPGGLSALHGRFRAVCRPARDTGRLSRAHHRLAGYRARSASEGGGCAGPRQPTARGVSGFSNQPRRHRAGTEGLEAAAATTATRR